MASVRQLNIQSFKLHCLLTPSIDNRNLNIFPYKLNLFTKIVYIRIDAALQSIKYYAALTSSAE